MPVKFETTERVAILTINRPLAMNALDNETLASLNKAWIDFRDNPELRVAIITGAGGKSFSAGADIRSLAKYYAATTSEERKAKADTEPGLGGITRNLEIWKPVIAAINGYCLAGGLELALACDIRIASETAVFGFPEATRGIIPVAGGTQRLARLVPLGKGLEMLFTGDSIDAQEAYRIGLVNKVVPPDQLLPEAVKMAERICRNAPLALQAAKEAVYRGIDLPLSEGLRLEQFLADPVFLSEDAKEGPKAFFEKRTPGFKGE
ncbi:MAG: enoyl-CoA hydratase-related protein [Pseudomonadota bacterium]